LRKPRMTSLLLAVVIAFYVFAPVASPAYAGTATDLDGHFAERQFTEWLDRGWVSGYPDGSLKPDRMMTRAEFAAIVNRSQGFTESNGSTFKDVAATDWYARDASIAQREGYIRGYGDGTFRGGNGVSREEAAIIAAQLLDLPEADEQSTVGLFLDAATISVWSRPAIAAVVAAGVMQGYPDHTFKPTRKLTRAEAIVLLDNVWHYRARVYDEPGVFGPDSGMDSINSDVTIQSPDVTLQNLSIAGNLTLDAAVGSGDVQLNNVKVQGSIYVYGGGPNSVILDSVTAPRIVIVKQGGDVRIVAAGSTSIGTTELGSGAILEAKGDGGAGFGVVTTMEAFASDGEIVLRGDFDSITIDVPGVRLVVESGTVKNLSVGSEGSDSSIRIDSRGSVGTLTLDAPATIAGTGGIGTANVNASGVKIAQKPSKVNKAEGVEAEIGAGSVGTAGTGGNTGNTGSSTDLAQAVQAVNDADTVAAMKAALVAGKLGLNRDGYTQLTDFQQDAVAKFVFYARNGGYADKAAIQEAWNTAMGMQFNVAEEFDGGDSASGFTVINGDWAVSGGKYVLTRNESKLNDNRLSYISVYDKDLMGDFSYTMTLNVTPRSESGWDDGAILFNYIDPQNFYFVSLNESNDAETHGIFKVVNNVQTELADFTGQVLSAQDYRVNIERRGETTTVRIDGAVWGAITDTAIITGKVGAGSLNDGVSFDQFKLQGTEYSDITPPIAPTGLQAEANSAGQLKLTWTASQDDVGIKQYKIWRDLTEIGTASSNVFVYYGSGDGLVHDYYVKAYDYSGKESSVSNTVSEAAVAAAVNFPLTESVINAAFNAALLQYIDAGGVFEWSPVSINSATALYYLTLASGEVPDLWGPDGLTAAERALQHIRSLISGGKEMGAAGDGMNAQGYNPALHALLFAKHTPVIWNELTAEEKGKIDLLFQAVLVGANWGYDDENSFATGLAQRGDFAKDWNANLREGGIGAAIAAGAYFGKDEADAFLAGFDYDDFMARIDAAGFTNIKHEFEMTGKEEHIDPATGLISTAGPSGKDMIEAVTRSNAGGVGFTYFGYDLSELFGWHKKLEQFMWSNAVAATGGDGKGYLLKGADDLPNVGLLGMGQEFDAMDAEGPRSSLGYVYLGWQNSLINRYTVEHFGYYADVPVEEQLDIKNRMNIGTTDLLYKGLNGYHDYHKGSDRGNQYIDQNDPTFAMISEMWIHLIDNPRTAVAAVNAANDADTMRTALLSPDISLIVHGFNGLTSTEQSSVLQQMLTAKPSSGFATKAAVQDSLYEAVKTALRETAEQAAAEAIALINEATTVAEMRDALIDDSLGLNLAGYSLLADVDQEFVANELLAQRPGSGFANLTAFTEAFSALIDGFIISRPSESALGRPAISYNPITANIWSGESFVAINQKLKKVSIWLYESNDADVTVEIKSGSIGSSGHLIDTATITSRVEGKATATFDLPVELEVGTTYYLKVSSQGSKGKVELTKMEDGQGYYYEDKIVDFGESGADMAMELVFGK